MPTDLPRRAPRRRAGPLPPSHNHNSTTSISPLRISSQILILQATYYAAMLILLLFTVLAAGADRTPSSTSATQQKPSHLSPRRPLDLLLSWQPLRGDTAVGWTLAICWLIGGGLAGSVGLLVVVARSKLVLDFVLTLHGIHLLAVCGWNRGLPRTSLWWGVQVGSCGVMMLGGLWGCRWRELRPLSFGTGSVGSSTAEGGRGKRKGLITADRRGGGREEEYELLDASARRNGRAAGGPRGGIDLEAG